MTPYLMTKSTGYKSIIQKKDIDFKQLLENSDIETTLIGPLLLANSIDQLRVDSEDFMMNLKSRLIYLIKGQIILK